MAYRINSLSSKTKYRGKKKQTSENEEKGGVHLYRC